MHETSNLKLQPETLSVDLFLQGLPRYLFFTGKGGVGKTSLSCATAVSLAEQGKKTLLVSTDPASNLDQVLETALGTGPTPVLGTVNLWALNIDPRRAAAQYRERVVAPYRGVLPPAAVAQIEEQLSGACTVEIAAFDEFSRLITDNSIISGFEHIIFDTAPTGHTLRLLNLSAAWKGYLESSSGSASCLGPMSGLKGQRHQFEETLTTLANDRLTKLVLVARPDRNSITEAYRTSNELAHIGIANQCLAMNGILGNHSTDDDSVALAMRRREVTAIENLPLELQKLPRIELSLSPIIPIGISGLHHLLHPNNASLSFALDSDKETVADGLWNLANLIDTLNLKSGVVMTMGKGGVGKTTLASIIAVEMAKRGAKVHLTTSDPAAHLDFSLAEKHRNLRVSRIDPKLETEAYRKEVLLAAEQHLDEEGRRLLKEDLQSPCTEEIAVFRAFARVVDEAKDSVVVVDTAPTGHTILLLDATQAYHREVSRNRSSVPDEVKSLLPRLRDSLFTRILIVTLPEATPVQEAIDLQRDLERAQISPYAWIINQSLYPLTIHHPVLMAKRANEVHHIRAVRAIAQRVVIVPWQETN